MGDSFTSKPYLDVPYHEFKTFDHWVHPNAEGISISLSHLNDYKIEVVISSRDLEDYIPNEPDLLTPGRIYINNILIELNSKAEQWVIYILKQMLKHQTLGHPQELGVYTVHEVILFFTSHKALAFSKKLMNK